MKALVLAAGKSTRIASISNGLPKPLIQVDGLSIIERNLRWLSHFGIQDIWINLHYKPEEIMNHLQDGSRLGLKIEYLFEPEILGTAGALSQLPEWDEPLLVVYGDNLFNFSLDAFIDFHHLQTRSLSLGLFHQETHLHTGIAGGKVLLQEQTVKAFIENGPSDSSHYVNAGIYLLNPEIKSLIPEKTFYDFGKDLFPKCINLGINMSGHIINGYCLGLDTPESYNNALKIIK